MAQREIFRKLLAPLGSPQGFGEDQYLEYEYQWRNLIESSFEPYEEQSLRGLLLTKIAKIVLMSGEYSFIQPLPDSIRTEIEFYMDKTESISRKIRRDGTIV